MCVCRRPHRWSFSDAPRLWYCCLCPQMQKEEDRTGTHSRSQCLQRHTHVVCVLVSARVSNVCATARSNPAWPEPTFVQVQGHRVGLRKDAGDDAGSIRE